MTSENRRKALHVATGFLAFPLRFLPAAGAVALASALVLHNVFALPRYCPSIVRGRAGRPDVGLVTYPVGVLAILLLFHQRLEWAAACWAVLAFGDGAAGLVGPRRPLPDLPWNHDKSWAGSAAFVIAGTAGGALALWFVAGGGPRAVDPGVAVMEAGTAAMVAAAAESLRLRLDDNVRVLGGAAAGLALTHLVSC